MTTITDAVSQSKRGTGLDHVSGFIENTNGELKPHQLVGIGENKRLPQPPAAQERRRKGAGCEGL